MKRVLWLSRHPILPSQAQELRRLFGEDVRILKDPLPFSDADAIIERFKRQQADDLLVVAPLSVVDALVKRGIRPLWAQMETLPAGDPRAEVVASGRHYRFVGFKRVNRLELILDPVEPIDTIEKENPTDVQQ